MSLQGELVVESTKRNVWSLVAIGVAVVEYVEIVKMVDQTVEQL